MDCSGTKIIVRLSGGVITDVFASPDLPKKLKVVILDYDEDVGDFTLDQEIAETEIDKHQVINIY